MALDWVSIGFQALQALPAVLTFAGLVKVWYDNKNKAEADKAKTAALGMATDAVRLLANEALDNAEKRKRAVAMVVEALPDKWEKHVPVALVEQLTETAWQLIVKPTLDKPITVVDNTGK